MFIYIYNIEHRNLEIRKTRNDFSVQVRNFLLPLSLKVLRHEEREAQSFYSGFFICLPSRATPAQGLREQAKVNPSRSVSSLNSTIFLQIPKILRAFQVHDIIRTRSPRFQSRAIVTSLSDTSTLPACARVNTCVNVAPT